MLVGVPLPAEAAVPADGFDVALRIAEARAREQGIVGKALTPFLGALTEATWWPQPPGEPGRAAERRGCRGDRAGAGGLTELHERTLFLT